MVYDFPLKDVKDRRDRQLVDQFGAIDLRVASATGVVEGDASAVEANYNGIDNPASILGKPDDIFSAYRMHNYVTSLGAEAPKVTPVGSEPSA